VLSLRGQPKWNRYGAGMASITLKNIPADLHRELKKRAEEHHRSLNKRGKRNVSA